MADKVVINVDGKQVEIPEFAYDRSIKDLENQVKKMSVALEKLVGLDKELKKQSKAGNKTATEEAETSKKQLELEKKTAKQQKKSNDEQLKQLEKNGKQQGVVNKALAATGGQGGVFSGLFGGLTKFSKFLNPVTAGLAGLANGIIAATKFFLRLGQLDNTLFRRGFDTPGDQGVAQGVASFAAQAADASLSLDQFAELVQEFGITAGEFGTKAISQAIVGVQNLTEEQGYLGLSNQELAAATLESAEVMRQLGFTTGTGSAEIAKQTVEVLRNTQSFTRLTNVSNDVIRNLTIQASQIEAFSNALNMLPREMRMSTLKSSQMAFAGLASLGEDAGGQLTTALSEGIGRGGLQFTQFGQDLARVSPGLLTSLQDLQNATKPGGDVVGALDDFRKSIINTGENSREFLRALEISGDPMAKFVINLTKLSSTIDDVTFKQLVALKTSINPNELGKAQAQLRLAIEKVRTAFQKLLISFLTPEVVAGFSKTVDVITDALGGLANWLKTDGFNLLQTGFNKLVSFFSSAGSGIATIFDTLSNKVAGSISAGISRGIALAVPGGDNAKKLAMYDEIQGMLKNNPNDPDKLKKAYAMLRRGRSDAKSTDPWAEYAYKNKGSGFLQNYIQNEIGQYYGKPLFSSGETNNRENYINSMYSNDAQASTTTNTVSPFSSGVNSRSKIRIMPMFGDPKTMAEQDPQKKIAMLLEDQNKLLERIAGLEEEIKNSTVKSSSTQEKIYQDRIMSQT